MVIGLYKKLGRFVSPSVVKMYVEDKGPDVAPAHTVHIGGSWNHATMRNVAWALVFDDWRYIDRALDASLSDPKVGIGARQALSPCYDAGWGTVPIVVAYHYGPRKTRRLARKWLRAWAVLARFGLSNHIPATASVQSGPLVNSWRPRKALPYFACSAAARGLFSVIAGWWQNQVLVATASHALLGERVNPLTWIPDEPDPSSASPHWALWALRTLTPDPVLTPRQRQGWHVWRPRVLLRLARGVPFGPGGAYHCAWSPNDQVTAIEFDPHGTKPAINIGQAGLVRNALYSIAPYQGQGHRRRRTQVTARKDGRVEFDCEGTKVSTTPRRHFVWSDRPELA